MSEQDKDEFTTAWLEGEEQPAQADAGAKAVKDGAAAEVDAVASEYVKSHADLESEEEAK